MNNRPNIYGKETPLTGYEDDETFIGMSENGEPLFDESDWESHNKTNKDRFRLGVTIKQRLLCQIDHDRIPYTEQKEISQIVGQGPGGWGQYMASLSETDWQAVAKIVAKICGQADSAVCGMRLTETTNRGNGWPVWGISLYTRASNEH